MYVPSAVFKRDPEECWGMNCVSEWAWARWILLVFFLVAFGALVFIAIRINMRRSLRGQSMIRGTGWFTPPSYRQSERQYNGGAGSAGRREEEYVPVYTERANEQDLGYYDNDGVFHVNSKAEPMPPPPGIDAVPAPAPTYHALSQEGDYDMELRQYYGGTQLAQTVQTAPAAQAAQTAQPEQPEQPARVHARG